MDGVGGRRPRPRPLGTLEVGQRFRLDGIPTRTGTVRSHSPSGTTVLYDGWAIPPEKDPDTNAVLYSGSRWSPCLISAGTSVVPITEEE